MLVAIDNRQLRKHNAKQACSSMPLLNAGKALEIIGLHIELFLFKFSIMDTIVEVLIKTTRKMDTL